MPFRSPKTVARKHATATHVPRAHHDHAKCAADAMRTAGDVCARRGARLTDIRRRVLNAVWAGHAPIGAYDILAALNAERGRIAPMAVYRALDFLIAQGLVHRLASLNAFVGCAQPRETHTAHFMICRVCKSATELDGATVTRAVRKVLSAHGFVAESEIVEVQGVCAHCGRA
jgi:Fur family zinc uptake transcriptional regulator